MFEGFSDPYYYDLGRMDTNDEYEDLRELYYQTKGHQVPDRIRDRISGLLKEDYFVITRNSTIMPFSSTGQHLCIYFKSGSNIYPKNKTVDKFEIFQLPDDWFLVLERVRTFASGDGINKYYKCDQFEGLVKLLKDKKVI